MAAGKKQQGSQAIMTAMLERYMFGRILHLAGLLLAVLVFLTLLYLSVAYTRDDNYSVPLALLVKLSGVNFSRYLPRLLTISLFLATLLCYLRLQSGRELIAMATAGFGFAKHIRIAMIIAFVVTSITATMTFFISPKMEASYNVLRSQIKQLWSDPDLLQPGKFYNDQKFSLYFGNRDDNDAMVDGVYTYLRQEDGYVVVVADSASFHKGTNDNDTALIYRDGTIYNNGASSRGSIDFSVYNVPLQLPHKTYDDYDAWEIGKLLEAGTSRHYAAVHKRLAPVVATFLLPLFALLLVLYGSRWRSQYMVVFAAIIGFFVYYNLIDLAYTVIRKDTIVPVLGMLAPHLFLLSLMLALWIAVRSAPYQIRS